MQWHVLEARWPLSLTVADKIQESVEARAALEGAKPEDAVHSKLDSSTATTAYYFSPSLASVALGLGARPCPAPGPEGLCQIVGSPSDSSRPRSQP